MAGDKAYRRKPGSRRANHVERLAQTLVVQERGIRIDGAGSHVTHGEPVDVQAIDDRHNHVAPAAAFDQLVEVTVK
jgi:hypothetical protein